MGSLSRDKAVTGYKRATVDVALPEFDGDTVTVQAPTAGRVLDLKNKLGNDENAITSAVLAECLIDDDGEPLFKNGDGEAFVRGLSVGSFHKIQREAARLMGFRDKDIEEVVKNSEPTP